MIHATVRRVHVPVRMRTIWRLAVTTCALLFVFPPRSVAQEPPYFVTYSSALEEPGNLEISVKNT